MGKINRLIFLTSGSDFHAKDWYDAVNELINVDVILDSVNPHGLKNYFKNVNFKKLFIIDFLLGSRQFYFSDKLRNIIKMIFLPIQSIILKIKSNKKDIYWCHGVYFGLVCKIANVNYVVTPQGSEVLVRPYKNRIYKFFLQWTLSGADLVTVDSESMKKSLKNIGIKSEIIQNGIEIRNLSRIKIKKEKNTILSVRGCTKLYRIKNIAIQSLKIKNKYKVDYCFPFFNIDYLNDIKKYVDKKNILGVLSNKDYHKILSKYEYVISIPKSDSSPKSIYEAIFLGCKIIAQKNSKWINECTNEMKKRIIEVDLNNENWLKDAIQISSKYKNNFHPNVNTINLFSREKNILKFLKLINYDM
tara:strand:+ start:17886 stop:18962 length:1077 start_codon:yes stop_codon:yes gene_type:complete